MNPKRKNRLLLAGIILLLIAAYQFAFKKTFELRSELNELTQQQQELTLNKSKLALYSQENKYLDSILSLNNLSVDRSFEQNLLLKIDELRAKHKVKVISIDEPHQFVTDGATIQSYSLEFTGDFRNLMLFSSELEKLRLGIFTSVDFSKKKNYKTRRLELICTIILQRISQ